MNINSVLKITPAKLKALQSAGIFTATDLLNFAPRDYTDKSTISPISSAILTQQPVQIKGKVIEVNKIIHGKPRLEVILEDSSGGIKCVWFKGISYFQKLLKHGISVVAYGKISQYGKWYSMAHPEIVVEANPTTKESPSENQTAGLVPVYPGNTFFTKTYITSTVLQKWIANILNTIELHDILPDYLKKSYELPDLKQAYQWLHFPESLNQAKVALQRLKYDELLLFELAIHHLKLKHSKLASNIIFKGPGKFTRTFFKETLPFQLTDGQTTSLRDIRKDFESSSQMNRLIQGDVGSGKTIVALGAILMMIDNGYQTALMAPTEILAEQHFDTFSNYLREFDIDIRLLTGKRTTAQKNEIYSQTASGITQILIGTHAVIQEKVNFSNLGLIVIDEQHRFGVLQRNYFNTAKQMPHILTMSATPIPRSLALSVFGRLDISVIKGLPSGRKPIVTAVRTNKDRDKVYTFAVEILADGGQIYIVYPLIEESEKLDLSNAVEGYETVSKLFNNYNTGLLHGKMTSEEKESVMKGFLDGKTHILISTTVIEVGVNVPNASVMIIEHAERFGLSQLHQLRGRIGRGSRQSYCILMAGVKKTKTAIERLKTMTASNDGFLIAEKDLKLRGPGDFLGTKQSGIPDFKFSDIVQDQKILESAAKDAGSILSNDPELASIKHKELKKAFSVYLDAKKDFFKMT
ncbi:MAG: ATP-dependent DNA helicase RecG [Balneolales bacterium]|nr:ATP-dependent DNA helicase RecG [Balneolales bacterium]